MISVRYQTAFEPAAPFVNVTIRHPSDGRTVDLIPARVASAADRIVIPLSIANQLTLEPTRFLEFEGMGGHIEALPLFSVGLRIQGLELMQVEVAAHPAEPYVLLGRDVLNRYRLVLDGPNQMLEIG